jgi:hypothetical protein
MKHLTRASSVTALMTLACLCGNSADASPLYTLTTIDGPNPGLGGEFTFVQAISDKHMIVGFAFPNDPCTNAFLFDGSTFTRIQPPPPFAPCIQATGVNNDGKIVGTYGDGQVPGGGGGFLLFKGAFSSVGPLVVPPFLGPRTLPQGISNSGLIVGNFIDTSGQSQGFVDIGGSFFYFNVAGAQSTFTHGINDIGEVAGNFVDGTGGTHGYVDFWGFTKRFDFPGAQATVANGINDLSTVVGSYTDGANLQHGFVLGRTGFTTFDVPGAFATQLAGINNRGQIVGSYNKSQFHGFRADPVTSMAVAGPVRLGAPSIKVIIPSAPRFDAGTIDTASVTFGHAGTEASLAACQALAGSGGLACTFSTSVSALQCGDTQATLNGKLIDGTPIRGSDDIRIAGC